MILKFINDTKYNKRYKILKIILKAILNAKANNAVLD